jgi:acyl-CoA thioester hydrolase
MRYPRSEDRDPRSEDRDPRSEDRGPRSEVRTTRRVQFSETDAAGLVHFTCFFRYFEDAEHALWRDAGLSIHAENSPIGWPRISASCEFFRPLKFEQEFDVVVRIVEMTRRTISYTGEIVRDGERLAAGTWRIACVTKRADGTIGSVDIPSNVAERLKPSESRTTDVGPQPSDVGPRSSDVGPRPSDVGPRSSDVGPRPSDIA